MQDVKVTAFSLTFLAASSSITYMYMTAQTKTPELPGRISGQDGTVPFLLCSAPKLHIFCSRGL
ncbi:hypothetical protein E2C01_072395 [Portunus trituberculatus]|uniref:Uncharacterized protein n=1 Tax=Portunus trituberculatus TaxID=210409 RepID=A0A5B7I7L6_PORTR|nr:hypothetical protein [Portunus trituberculatus]